MWILSGLGAVSGTACSTIHFCSHQRLVPTRERRASTYAPLGHRQLLLRPTAQHHLPIPGRAERRGTDLEPRSRTRGDGPHLYIRRR